MFAERRKKRVRNKKPRKPWTEEARARHMEGVSRHQEERKIYEKALEVVEIAERIGEDWTETLFALLDRTCFGKGDVALDEWLKRRVTERRHEDANKQREGCRLYQNGECQREDCWRLLQEHKSAA